MTPEPASNHTDNHDYDDDGHKSGGHKLVIWTVYANPDDYPGMIVVRPHFVLPDGTTRACCCGRCAMVGAPSELWRFRNHMLSKGLVMIARHPSDPPAILETWL